MSLSDSLVICNMVIVVVPTSQKCEDQMKQSMAVPQHSTYVQSIVAII